MKIYLLQETRWRVALFSVLFLLLAVKLHAGGLSWGVTPEDDLVITPGPMKSPMRIASEGNGMLLVSDYQGGEIFEVDTQDPAHPAVLFKIEGHPLAVEVYGSLVLVGNDSTGAIELYRRDGTKLDTRSGRGFRFNVAQMQPSDMAFDLRRRLLFVVDSLNREVKVFSTSGRLMSSFGLSAPLSDPKGIALDTVTRQVFVSDYGDPRIGISASINVFDYEGNLLQRISGNFGRPQGLTVDRDHLYVVDAIMGQILVFDRNSYTYKEALGSFGVNVGQLLLPMDLVHDPSTNRLWVTNNRMGLVAGFALPGSTDTAPPGSTDPVRTRSRGTSLLPSTSETGSPATEEPAPTEAPVATRSGGRR